MDRAGRTEPGEGRLRVQAGRVTFEWPHGSREVALGELERVEPDGECLRVSIGGDELCLMPMGKPDSPAGRRQQSIQLAKMLRR